MKGIVSIRREQPQDREAVQVVVTRAFERENEAKLVEALRATATPLVSLVALVDDEVVGHILFTPVTVEGHVKLAAMGLAPMSVLPEHQQRGIGSLLIVAGLRACQEIGFDVVFVVGHMEYYTRFDFEQAAPRGLQYKGEQFDPYFFVRELTPGTLDGITGLVNYHPEFDKV